MEAKVILSDLTGQPVDEASRVRLVVRQHPDLDEPVCLDASTSEVEDIKQAGGNFVVLQVVAGGTSGDQLVVPMDAFEGLFTGDPMDALEVAPKLNASRSDGSREKRDPAYLQAVRNWGRANGWPDLSDRGRVPAEVEAAYVKAS